MRSTSLPRSVLPATNPRASVVTARTGRSVTVCATARQTQTKALVLKEKVQGQEARQPVPVAPAKGFSYRELRADNGKTYLVAPRFAAGSFGAVHRAIDVDMPGRRLVAKQFFLGDKGGKFKSGDRDFVLTPEATVERELGILDTVRSPLRPEARIRSAEGEQQTLLAVMPHMDGDLSWPLRFGKRVGLSDFHLRIMLRSAIAQAADDLQRIHQLNHMHFDVRPENIYFDEKGNASMGDLGLASLYMPGEAMERRCGTVEHMAPEMLCYKPVSPKAEVWSLFSTWMTALLGTKNLIASAALPRAREELDQAVEAKMDVEYPEYGPMFRGILKGGLTKDLGTSADSPLQAHADRITSLNDLHMSGPKESLNLRVGHSRSPYSQTVAAAAHIDAPMMALGLKHVLVGDPAQRISMAGLRDEIRALQPASSPEERLARTKFRELASSSLVGRAEGPNGAVVSAAQEFNDLRKEAACRHGVPPRP